MCRTKKNGKSKKGLKTLQKTATLSTLRQNSECGVANVKTTAGDIQLFSFGAWPEQKISFRYAVVVASVVVLKVSIDNWYGETLCLCTWRMCLNLNFNYFARAECFVWNFVTRDQRNISRSTGEAVVTAKLVLWIGKCVKSILIWIFLSSANEVNLSPLI